MMVITRVVAVESDEEDLMSLLLLLALYRKDVGRGVERSTATTNARRQDDDQNNASERKIL
jgi:hypothetical protein